MRGVIATSPRPDPGLMASLAKSLALGGGRTQDALFIAEHAGASPRVVNTIKAAIGSLWTGDTGATGFEDASFITTQFLPFLRNGSLFYRLLDAGMTRVPLKTRIGFTTANATAWVVGEGAAVPVSGMAAEAAGVDRHKGSALIILTQDMIRSTGASGEALIARELRRGVGSTVDAKFIDLVSSDLTPLTSAGNDAAAVAADLRALVAAVGPTSESRLMWAMAPDVALAASTLIGAGGFVFPEMTPMGGRILGIDAVVTDGLLAGSIALLDATGIAGDSELITVEASDQTTIQMSDAPTMNSVTPTGVTAVSMYQTNSVALMATSWFGAWRFRDEAVAIMDGVTWGAAVEAP